MITGPSTGLSDLREAEWHYGKQCLQRQAMVAPVVDVFFANSVSKLRAHFRRSIASQRAPEITSKPSSKL